MYVYIVGQSTGLLIPRSSVRFRQKLKKTENSNLHGFELRRYSNKVTKLLFQPSNKGTKLLFQRY